MTDQHPQPPEGLPLRLLAESTDIIMDANDGGVAGHAHPRWRNYIIHACNTLPALQEEVLRLRKALSGCRFVAKGYRYKHQGSMWGTDEMDEIISIARAALEMEH